jgi:hypothetical protein
VSLVELFVRRKTHVAIDAEDAAIGVADQRDADRFKLCAERQEQRAERRQHLGVVDRLARLKPKWIVVVT